MEQLFNTLVAGNVFVALYLLMSIIQSARKNVRAGCGVHFFAFMAIVLYTVALVTLAALQEPITQAVGIAYAVGIALLIGLGVILLIWDMRSKEYKALYSRGLMSILLGSFLGIAYFAIPIIPQNIVVIPSPTAIADGLSRTVNTANVVPTDVVEVTPMPTLQVSPTITNTPLPSPSPTRTLRAYVPPTITPTPEFIAVDDSCGATVTQNLNVRAQDNVDSEVVAIIPAERYIEIFGKNLDGTWWQTEWEGNRGWVLGELLSLDLTCN